MTRPYTPSARTHLMQFAIAVVKADGFVLDKMGDTGTNIPHLVVHHSPSGFSWGYLGSGPAELALNILEIVATSEGGYHSSTVKVFDGSQVSSIVWALHQKYKEDVIATLAWEDSPRHHITYASVAQWLATNATQLEPEREDTC